MIERLMERRPQVMGGLGMKAQAQRLMSHWTPVKDGDGAVAWVVLIVTPVVGQ